MPLLSGDYGSFGDDGKGSGKQLTFLAITVRPFGVYWACVVDSKGPTPAMVKSLAQFIVGCGLVRFAYRSDKEASLKSLIEDAVRESGRTGLPIKSRGDKYRQAILTAHHSGKPVDLEALDAELEDEHDDALGDLLGPSPASASTELAVPEHSHAG